MNRWFLLFPVALTGTLLFIIDKGPGPASAASQLYGFAHLIFFAFLAWWLFKLFNSTRRAFLRQAFVIMLVIICIGAIIELIQPHFGRTGSWHDLGIDLLGGMLGIAFFSPGRRKLHRRFLICAQILIVSIAVFVFHGPAIALWDMWQASRTFPVLSDFETRFEAKRWSRGRIDESVARHGGRSLNIPLGKEKYTGTSLSRSLGDWRGYTTFAFSLFNPDDKLLLITVSIRDREHSRRGGDFNDRFNRTYAMKPGWNDILIPIDDIQNAPSDRKLELANLSEVIFFAKNLSEPRQIYLDHVRLIR